MMLVAPARGMAPIRADSAREPATMRAAHALHLATMPADSALVPTQAALRAAPHSSARRTASARRMRARRAAAPMTASANLMAQHAAPMKHVVRPVALLRRAVQPTPTLPAALAPALRQNANRRPSAASARSHAQSKATTQSARSTTNALHAAPPNAARAAKARRIPHHAPTPAPTITRTKHRSDLPVIVKTRPARCVCRS
ncbi:hypothetical protein GCM10027093_18640 [Paraburkholderia jirisanensis]